MNYTMRPIGYINTCFKEKFATPRQPGLVTKAKALLQLQSPLNHPDTVIGLEGFSHIWLLFAFHQTVAQGWKSKVRPPRLGGNRKLGVFATRSPFRPNPIGLSLVQLERIDTNASVCLHLLGVDLIDGTPILDIKPYLASIESIDCTRSGFASTNAVLDLPVHLSDQAESVCLANPHLSPLITQVLRQDPRPAYQRYDQGRSYGCYLDQYNIRWRVLAHCIQVDCIEPA
jgi:tRNA-Thr(GGU) m(6)t(6)A37 methyltransferase TsaA